MIRRLPRFIRFLTTTPSISSIPSSSYIYLDSVTPIPIARFDPRSLLAKLQFPTQLISIQSLVEDTLSRTGIPLTLDNIIPREKDGGVLIKFSGLAQESEQRSLEESLRESVSTSSLKSYLIPSFPSLFSPPRPTVHLVVGSPFLEDMHRYPNRILRVEFEGPDPTLEDLYTAFRPFGRIHNIVPPSPTSKDVPRSSTVVFNSMRSATAALHCLNASKLGSTKLHILYADRLKSYVVREWISSHPRIMLPLIVALLGAVSLTVFDPIREMFVRHHVEGFSSWKVVQYLKKETGRLGLTSREDNQSEADTGIERDREVAISRLHNWLRDAPDTFIILNGARGSGKETLLHDALTDRANVMTIDLVKISKASGGVDAKVISALATEVGYFPQFAVLASLSGLIDLASMGLIGTKSGFSSDTSQQLKQILDVTSNALRNIAEHTRKEEHNAAIVGHAYRATTAERNDFIERTKEYGIRDGRLHIVAGNGLLSELGAGLEEGDHHVIFGPRSAAAARDFLKDHQDAHALRVHGVGGDKIPIVVIKDYALRAETKQDLLNDILAEWAASLVENGIAHVIFTTDSATTALKPLAKAFPSKSFNSIALTDASPEASFAFVAAKLREVTGDGEENNTMTITPESKDTLAKLGGRRTDLELLITKVQAGQSVEDAVNEIIDRAVNEVRKNYLGEGSEKAWVLIKSLANDKDGEIKYADVLYNLFGGDEASLKTLEANELIAIHHLHGRPNTITPGKPSFLSAFRLLTSDTLYASSLDYHAVLGGIKRAELGIATASKELIELSSLASETTGRWRFGGTTPIELEARVRVLLDRMRASEAALERGEKEKRRLAKLFKESV